jgi:putative NIF3 family GTP cyclohydrolase 1 type 2
MINGGAVMTVQDIVNAVLASTGGKRFEKTCDQLIAGDYCAQATGVATTFMATVDVIRRTIALGYNFIITHEPTYFTGMDTIDWAKDDPVYLEKKKLIDENGISIWRFHDHMHIGKSDGIYDGLLKELGWESYVLPNQPAPHCYAIPETTLESLARFFKQKLEMDTVRIVGRPGMKCRRVGILVGGGSLGLGREEMPAALMREQNLDVMVCGEITEWTLSAYVRDAADLGFNKGMLIVGHERTEEAGMKHMADWLRPLIPGVPVAFVDAKEPFAYL